MPCTFDLNSVLTPTTPLGGTWSVTDGTQNNGSYMCPADPLCAGDDTNEVNPGPIVPLNPPNNNLLDSDGLVPGCYRVAYYTQEGNYNSKCDCGACTNFEFLVMPSPRDIPSGQVITGCNNCGPSSPDVINLFGFFDCNGAVSPTYSCGNQNPCTTGIIFGPASPNEHIECNLVRNSLQSRPMVPTGGSSQQFATGYNVNFSASHNTTTRAYGDCNGNPLVGEYNITMTATPSIVGAFYNETTGQFQACAFMEANNIEEVVITLSINTFLNDQLPGSTCTCSDIGTLTITRGTAPEPGTPNLANNSVCQTNSNIQFNLNTLITGGTGTATWHNGICAGASNPPECAGCSTNGPAVIPQTGIVTISCATPDGIYCYYRENCSQECCVCTNVCIEIVQGIEIEQPQDQYFCRVNNNGLSFCKVDTVNNTCASASTFNYTVLLDGICGRPITGPFEYRLCTPDNTVPNSLRCGHASNVYLNTPNYSIPLNTIFPETTACNGEKDILWRVDARYADDSCPADQVEFNVIGSPVFTPLQYLNNLDTCCPTTQKGSDLFSGACLYTGTPPAEYYIWMRIYSGNNVNISGDIAALNLSNICVNIDPGECYPLSYIIEFRWKYQPGKEVVCLTQTGSLGTICKSATTVGNDAGGCGIHDQINW